MNKHVLRYLKYLLVLTLIAVNSVTAQTVKPEVARKVAINKYLSVIPASKMTDIKNLKVTLVQTGKDKSVPLYYIFNINQNDGFVIVAADENVTPILAYATKGKFSDTNAPPAFTSWMQNYEEQIKLVKEKNIKVTKAIKSEWTNLCKNKSRTKSTVIVGPLIETQWGQGCNYNMYCPSNVNCTIQGYCNRTPSGCGATAMGQIMKYWNFPYHGNGSKHLINTTINFDTIIDFSAATYSWSFMNNNYPNYNKISELLINCGVAVEMNYNCGGSNSNLTNTISALKSNFRYSPDAYLISRDYIFDNDWKDTLINELNNQRPILYRADDINPLNGGHAFICDGYDSEGNFHFNWGWDGIANNAYFTIEDLNPALSIQYHFNDDQGAIFNLHPVTTVNTTIATNISHEAALLEGNIYPNEKPTIVQFQYGLNTNSYITVFANNNPTPNKETQLAQATIDNLLPLTTYHYRILATNTEGTFFGEDKTFTTAAAPNVAVTGVDVTPATLNLLTGNSGITITAIVNPANATNKNVSWTSSNPSVATVNANGVVTAITSGIAYITAHTEDGNFTNNCLVSVTNGITYPAPLVNRIEYYFDNDPGIGNRAIYYPTSATEIDVLLNIDVSLLSNGLHTLYVMAYNVNEEVSFTKYHTFYKNVLGGLDIANITQLEFYFDNDPGEGNRNIIPVSSANNIELTQNIDINGLTNGLHTLFILARAENGVISFTKYHTFYKNVLGGSDISNITQVEYYFDNDPGEGNGHQVSVAADNELDLSIVVDINGLLSGSHVLFIRAKNEQGAWSFIHIYKFCRKPESLFSYSNACENSNTLFMNNSTNTTPQTQYSWDFNGDGITDNTNVNPTYSFTNSGTYSTRLIAYNDEACQDTVIKTVVVNPNVTTTISQTICDGDSFLFNGQYLTTAGSYSANYVSHNGCDSTYILHLSITTVPKTLYVNLFLEGLYAGSGLMRQAQGLSGPQFGTDIADRVSVELHSASPPYTIAYEESNVELHTNGMMTISAIPCNISGYYYIVIKHRNSIQTWSALPYDFSGAGPFSYDFSTASSQAYGNNQKLMGTVYAIWGGDPTQDGIVDGSDMSVIDNGSQPPILHGYYPEDINGDGIVDGSDMTIIDNNSSPPAARVLRP